MNKFFKNTALLSLLVIAFSACKKDKAAKTNAQLLSQNQWVLTNYTVHLGTRVDNKYTPMPDCYKDNQFVFSLNGIYEANHGLTKCNISDEQIINSGNWLLKDNNHTLEINITTATGLGSTGKFEYKVIELTETELQLNIDDAGILHKLFYKHS